MIRKSKPKKEPVFDEATLVQIDDHYRAQEDFLGSFQLMDKTTLMPSFYAGRIYAPANQGPFHPDVILVFDQPYIDDYVQGQTNPKRDTEDSYDKYFHENWNVLFEKLKTYGLLNRTYITYKLRYSTFRRRVLAAEQNPFRELFDKEMDLFPHKVIIPMGAEAYKWVMKKNAKLSDYIGEKINSPYGPCIPCYSIDYISDMAPLDVVYLDTAFQQAKEIVTGKTERKGIVYPDNYEVVAGLTRAKTIIQHYVDFANKSPKKLKVAYDCEWQVGNMYDETEVLYTYQFCAQSDKAFVFDLINSEGKENLELLHTIKPLMEHPNIFRMGWNIRVDDKRLLRRGINIPQETLGFDGMKAMAFIDSGLRKGLENGIRHFTSYESYFVPFFQDMDARKISHKDLVQMRKENPGLFYLYCAGDALAHFKACANMHAILQAYIKQGGAAGRAAKYYYEIYLPLTNYFIDLENTGLPVDQELMEKLTKQYTDKYNELSILLQNHVVPKYMPMFNTNSAKDKVSLLYDLDKLALEPPYYVKQGKPKTAQWYLEKKKKEKETGKTNLNLIGYGPSANSKSLATLLYNLKDDDARTPERRQILTTLLNMNRVGVFANKFFSKRGLEDNSSEPEEPVFDPDPEDEAFLEPIRQSYWKAINKDGRIHSDFWECLDNFRARSIPNIQNPASKVLAHIPQIFVPGYLTMTKEEQKSHEAEIPPNIRQIFYTGSPDWVFAEADIASAEIFLSAALSGDKIYKGDVLSGSFHLIKAREYFDDPKLTKSDIGKYTVTKAINFRVIYCADMEGSVGPIKADIFAESGYDVEEKQLLKMVRTWNRYEQYIRYRDKCKAQAVEDGYIENARGMRFYFHKHNTKNPKLLAGFQNQALNWPVSGELALLAWDIHMRMKRHFESKGEWLKYVYPLNSVHDAIYFMAHKDMMKDNYLPNVIKEIFTTTKCATGDTLGVEVVVTDRWKGKQKFFNKETAWDPEKKLWIWKD